ncbi:DUF502 domain-containing protein [Limisalsivibrio acetivorans]|uniref:DUF502 domain-containing protein n=1 Tax=Limisalsivibrio acetivorans TaxID=1304888 RepID=UPI0003B76ACA|nr:DUF502 domain-containing protein [Limisalsivibrio acetivorans]
MKRFRIFLRNAFFAGILATLPLFVTFYFIRFVFVKFSGFLLPYFDLLVIKYDIIVPPYIVKIISFIVILIAILFIGLFAKNYAGKKLLGAIEQLVSKIPFVKTVYGVIRQIVDAISTTSGTNFKKVVMIEYPRKGVYSLGFITKDTSDFFNEKTGEQNYSVFVPTTPNPTSGFILIVPESEVFELNITIDEGIKYVISAGLLEPVHKNVSVERIDVH